MRLGEDVQYPFHFGDGAGGDQPLPRHLFGGADGGEDEEDIIPLASPPVPATGQDSLFIVDESVPDDVLADEDEMDEVPEIPDDYDGRCDSEDDD